MLLEAGKIGWLPTEEAADGLDKDLRLNMDSGELSHLPLYRPMLTGQND
jgi:hypothetical protein